MGDKIISDNIWINAPIYLTTFDTFIKFRAPGFPKRSVVFLTAEPHAGRCYIQIKYTEAIINL